MTRVGASQVFFNVIAQWNTEKLIQNSQAAGAVMEAVLVDSLEAMMKPLDDLVAGWDSVMMELEAVTVAVGTATIEFEKFYEGNADLEVMRDTLIDIGERYSIVGADAIAAGSRAAQVGNLIGTHNIDILVEQAQILSEISDLGSEEAMRGIIQLQQQTGILYGNYTKAQFQALNLESQREVLTLNSAAALDTLNTVANRSVAMEGDLVKTLSNFASQGHLVGESFGDMASMAAVMLEAGEEAGTAGRALRMIYARMGGDINGARTKLEQMGIQMRDSSGDMLTMDQIMRNLIKSGWNEFSSAQKQNIAQTMAGNRHYVRFIKLMENYDRFIQLSVNELSNLQSASDQAAQAQEALSRQLERAQVRAENLKASIGEQLLPAMISTQEVYNGFLEAQRNITEGMGGFGEALGRLRAAYEVSGGFIKLGLGIRSMAVAMAMYASVEKGLLGIQIANEALHSRSATYLQYGQKASEEQVENQKYARYLQQAMNRELELQKHAKMRIALLERDSLGTVQQQEKKQERLSQLTRDSHRLGRERTSLTRVNQIIDEKGLKTFEARQALLKHEVRFRQRFVQFAEEAYKGDTGSRLKQNQMMIDMRLATDLRQKDIRLLQEGNNMMWKRADALQHIKAINEIIRGLQQSGLDDTGHKLKIDKQTRMVAQEALEARLKMSDLTYKGKDEARIDAVNNERKAIGDMIEKLKRRDDQLSFSKNEFDALEKAMRKNNGALMQNENLLKLHGISQKYFNNLKKEETVLSNAQNIISKQTNITRKQLLAISRELMPVNEQLALEFEQLAKAERNAMIEGKKLAEVNKLIQSGSKKVAQGVRAYNKRLAEQEAKAQKELGAATTGALNAAGFAMSVFGDNTTAATASILMMTTALGSQINTMTQQAAKALESAGNLTKMQKAAMAFKAVALGVVMLGVAAGMAHAAKRAQEFNQDLNNIVQGHDNLIQRIRAQEFMADEGLARLLGLGDVDMQKMRTNGDYAMEINDRLMDKSNQYYDGLTIAQKAAIDSTQQLTQAFLDLHDAQSGTFDTKSAEAINENIDDYFDSVSDSFFSIFETGFGAIDPDRFSSETAQLMDEFNASTRQFGMIFGSKYVTPNFQAMTQNMRDFIMEGGKLSDSQLKAYRDLFDNDEMYKALKNLNELMNTSSDAKDAILDVGEAGAEAGEGINGLNDDIQNFVETVYDFSDARDELFFGGKYGNVTGSLYKNVVKQGVGVLYNKSEIIVSNNFHGFFNELEAADRIKATVEAVLKNEV